MKSDHELKRYIKLHVHLHALEHRVGTVVSGRVGRVGPIGLRSRLFKWSVAGGAGPNRPPNGAPILIGLEPRRPVRPAYAVSAAAVAAVAAAAAAL